jgi:hypothetical protein
MVKNTIFLVVRNPDTIILTGDNEFIILHPV